MRHDHPAPPEVVGEVRRRDGTIMRFLYDPAARESCIQIEDEEGGAEFWIETPEICAVIVALFVRLLRRMTGESAPAPVAVVEPPAATALAPAPAAVAAIAEPDQC